MESARPLANRTYLETLLATFVSKLINYIVVRSLGCSVCNISSRFSPISVCFGQNNFILLQILPCFKKIKSAINKQYFLHAKQSLRGDHSVCKWKVTIFPMILCYYANCLLRAFFAFLLRLLLGLSFLNNASVNLAISLGFFCDFPFPI